MYRQFTPQLISLLLILSKLVLAMDQDTNVDFFQISFHNTNSHLVITVNNHNGKSVAINEVLNEAIAQKVGAVYDDQRTVSVESEHGCFQTRPANKEALLKAMAEGTLATYKPEMKTSYGPSIFTYRTFFLSKKVEELAMSDQAWFEYFAEKINRSKF